MRIKIIMIITTMKKKNKLFFDNVKKGFFNIGQSIKHLYKKDE